MARSRSITARLGDVFAETAQPAYILDEQRVVVYCNDACAAWTGLSADELIGERCDYCAEPSESRAAWIAAGLCPPPDMLAGETRQCIVSCQRADGPLSRRKATVVPLVSSDGSGSVMVLVGLHDVSTDEATDLAATEAARLHGQLRTLRHEMGARYRPDQLLGTSGNARQIREQIGLAVAARPRVVIWGPPGSGREHVARTIHYSADADANSPLLTLTCSVVDREMVQTTIRAFRRAPEGTASRRSTLLLLEVETLSVEAQLELAGFLGQSGFDLPVISTARNDVRELAKQGTFRADLAYALSTLEIELPALRQRSEDISILAQHFLELHNRARDRQLSGFVPEAMDLLTTHSWPKNIDELVSVVDEACRHAEGVWVTTTDLPDRIRAVADPHIRTRRVEESIQLDEFLVEIEKEMIERALRRSKGNKSKAARLLGIQRARLLRRIVQLGLAAETHITDVPFEPIEIVESGPESLP